MGVFFFFQAEDGIRDGRVTGVQTCALPISRMADEGRLPSVVIRRGRVQKTRRIPRAFVDRMVADACAGAQVNMEEYATDWLAEHALAPPDGEPSFYRDEH